MAMPGPEAIQYRRREIPWLQVIRFHKEVVKRDEESFFALSGGDDKSERWTSLLGFEPDSLAGPWVLDPARIRSRQVRLALEQEQHQEFYLGGPCVYSRYGSQNDEQEAKWRPLLYREVELRQANGIYEIVPREGNWSFTPAVYRLLHYLEAISDDYLDELIGRVIERAAQYCKANSEPMSRAVLWALNSEEPEIAAALSREDASATYLIKSAPWVLFAPITRFSAINRHLAKDYDRLEEILTKEQSAVGGLRLLEGQPDEPATTDVDVLPVIPLNESQLRAVSRILQEAPLTVISGPPGTGKSQVVVSALLNAWARGKTVLFASNNNKAVDVVRERIERFESEFPIAVRAGSRERRNIQEVLRRTLNMVGSARAGSGVGSQTLDDQRDDLLRRQAALEKLLESGTPQRMNEAFSAALKAYAQYRSYLSDLATRRHGLMARQADLGFGDLSIDQLKESLAETQAWLDKVEPFRRLIKEDEQHRSEILRQISNRERRRNHAVESVGLSCAEIENWQWLLTGPSPALLADWGRRIRSVLEKPVEHDLEPVKWNEQYDRWRSAEEALSWAGSARQLAEDIHRLLGELMTQIEAVEALYTEVETGREEIRSLGIPETVSISEETLRQWAVCFAQHISLPPRSFDRLPWSVRSRLRRQLSRLERELASALPLSVWGRFGVLDDSGRTRLSQVVEALSRWIELRNRWESARTSLSQIEKAFGTLRARAASIMLSDIPHGVESQPWQVLAERCLEGASLAEKAAEAWKKRVKAELVSEELRSIGKEWVSLASGVLIREAWQRGAGAEFTESVRRLVDHPDSATVVGMRTALYSGTLATLIEAWQTALAQQEEIAELEAQLSRIPQALDRVAEWWDERPDSAFVLSVRTEDWPDFESANAKVKEVQSLCEEWDEFLNSDEPTTKRKAREELDWAVDKLKQAIGILPPGSHSQEVKDTRLTILDNPEGDWPVQKLNDALAEYSPERIRARIQGIQADLERLSFEYAKARWLERLCADDHTVRAVDRLERALRQTRGAITEGHYATFRAALRAVPVWITTAQSAQSIPLEPELFDIVIIDEASQCTLTNLLPLMYRGKTLVVIGDKEQLPAIPTVRSSEELVLARKFGVEEHLEIIGHADNDVYSAASIALPRQQADVLWLVEHYRSNPQIIGFSNRHIYQKRLALKKGLDSQRQLPIASGVNSIPIRGKAEPGLNGRSWLNIPEAHAVIDLVRRLKEGDSRWLSLGVVTPFSAQKYYLREELDRLGLAAEVLVDTAHGFQGDERDVIIFSPVVAQGMAAGSYRWVESPHNLINVAITRAREVLFVVADFDVCVQQEGILRKLALYCKDIELLRSTSPAELELFTWMVMRGWDLEVHKRIGDIEVDFLLNGVHGSRIVVEVDGDQHLSTPEQDRARDAYLQAHGYTVLRVRAREVMETPHEVIHRIEEALGRG
jgi:very-short-patch-repair endonuclease